MRGSNPSGGGVFRTRPHWPCGPSILLRNGYLVSFTAVQRPGRGDDHLPTYSTEVKERVELYLFSPSELSWSILGCTFSPLLETAEKHAKRWSETEVGKLGNVA